MRSNEKQFIDNKLTLLSYIQKLDQIANGKEQVKKQTRKHRQETVNEVFKILNIPEFKYLENAKTDEKINKELQRSARTLSDKLEKYVTTKNKKLKFNEDETAPRGVRVSQYELNYLKNLQDNYNKIIDKSFEEFLENNPNLSQEEKEIMRGSRAYDPNGSEESYIPITFAPVNFINEIQKSTNIEYYIEETTREMNRFNVEVSHYNNDKFIAQLDNWIEENNINEDQKDIILAHFNQLSIMQKYNFNAQLEKRLAWVDSITRNPRSSKNYFEALTEIVMDQKNIEFQVVTNDMNNILAKQYFENKRQEKEGK